MDAAGKRCGTMSWFSPFLEREVHVIADHLASRKTKLVDDFLAIIPWSTFILHPPTIRGLSMRTADSGGTLM
jgi:hypothetical protein